MLNKERIDEIDDRECFQFHQFLRKHACFCVNFPLTTLSQTLVSIKQSRVTLAGSIVKK